MKYESWKATRLSGWWYLGDIVLDSRMKNNKDMSDLSFSEGYVRTWCFFTHGAPSALFAWYGLHVPRDPV